MGKMTWHGKKLDLRLIRKTALFTVVAEPEGSVVGTLDEDFAVESNAGDIMPQANAQAAVKKATAMIDILNGCPINSARWKQTKAQIAQANVTGNDR